MIPVTKPPRTTKVRAFGDEPLLFPLIIRTTSENMVKAPSMIIIIWLMTPAPPFYQDCNYCHLYTANKTVSYSWSRIGYHWYLSKEKSAEKGREIKSPIVMTAKITDYCIFGTQVSCHSLIQKIWKVPWEVICYFLMPTIPIFTCLNMHGFSKVPPWTLQAVKCHAISRAKYAALNPSREYATNCRVSDITTFTVFIDIRLSWGILNTCKV